jgi:hypothetical protein
MSGYVMDRMKRIHLISWGRMDNTNATAITAKIKMTNHTDGRTKFNRRSSFLGFKVRVGEGYPVAIGYLYI